MDLCSENVISFLLFSSWTHALHHWAPWVFCLIQLIWNPGLSNTEGATCWVLQYLIPKETIPVWYTLPFIRVMRGPPESPWQVAFRSPAHISRWGSMGICRLHCAEGTSLSSTSLRVGGSTNCVPKKVRLSIIPHPATNRLLYWVLVVRQIGMNRLLNWRGRSNSRRATSLGDTLFSPPFHAGCFMKFLTLYCSWGLLKSLVVNACRMTMNSEGEDASETQWAAVKMNLSLMTLPPQENIIPCLRNCTRAIQGYFPGWDSYPPMIWGSAWSEMARLAACSRPHSV